MPKQEMRHCRQFMHDALESALREADLDRDAVVRLANRTDELETRLLVLIKELSQQRQR